MSQSQLSGGFLVIRRLQGWMGPRTSWRRVVALTTVIALALTAVALAGSGTPAKVADALDGGAWLGSSNGSVAHVNGISARVDWLTGATAATFTVVQDRSGALVQRANGTVSTIDPKSMKVGQPLTLDTKDVVVAVGAGRTYLAYRSSGVVQQVDPLDLQPVGQPVALTGPIGSTTVDSQGVLYAEVTDPAEVATIDGSAIRGQMTSANSDGSAQLLSVGDQVAEVDLASQTVSILTPTKVGRTFALELPDQAQLVVPDHLPGPLVWLTDRSTQSLLGLNPTTGDIQTIKLSAAATTLGPPQAAGNFVFVYNQATSQFITVNSRSNQTHAQPLNGGPATQVFSKDGLVYANNFAGSQALVANDHGVVQVINKYTSTSNAPAAPAGAKAQAKPKKVNAPTRKHVVPRSGRRRNLKGRPKARRVTHPKPQPPVHPTGPSTSTTTPTVGSTTTVPPGSTTTLPPGSTTTLPPETTTIPPATTTIPSGP